MTGQRALLEYQAAGFFFPNAKGFRLNSAYGLPIQGSSADFAPRGIFFACSAQASSWIRLRENKIHGCKHEENHRSASTEIKSSLFIADIKHP
jgi:hypothetical protein